MVRVGGHAMRKTPEPYGSGVPLAVETDGIEPPYLSRPKAIKRTSVPW